MFKHSISVIALSASVMSVACFAQGAQTDSEYLQSLLTEVHQLRQEMEQTTLKTQQLAIVLHRLQTQEAAIALASQKVETARIRLTQGQKAQTELIAEIKRLEDNLSSIENPTELKGVTATLSQMKSSLEAIGAEEQQERSNEQQAEEALQTEQAKLEELENQLDQLTKPSQSLSTHPSSAGLL